MTNNFQDPVCGMEVEPQHAAASYEYNGTTYYFCSEGCRDAFQNHPERFIARTEHSHSHACC